MKSCIYIPITWFGLSGVEGHVAFCMCQTHKWLTLSSAQPRKAQPRKAQPRKAQPSPIQPNQSIIRMGFEYWLQCPMCKNAWWIVILNIHPFLTDVSIHVGTRFLCVLLSFDSNLIVLILPFHFKFSVSESIVLLVTLWSLCGHFVFTL